METRNTNSGKKYIIRLLVVLLVIFALLGVSIYYKSKADSLTAELRQTNMQLALKSFSSDERERRRAEAELLKNDEQSTRLDLMNAMLENDKKEILMLVNPWNPIKEGYEARIIPIGDDLFFDERAAGKLELFLDACKAEGWAPCPLSTYRTQEYQTGLFNDKMERLIQGGLATVETAYDLAAQEVAVPGTSEHQTGFTADIVDEFYPALDYSQSYSNTQKWMMEHCYEYGFILRFPEDKQDITGIIYEPWHYRYVGESVAKQIKELGITFEEYCEQYL